MKIIAQIVIFIFITSLMKPSFNWFVKDIEKCYSYCDLEKDTNNSEEKELEKKRI